MTMLKSILLAALVAGAAGHFSAPAWAGSCCGGGGGATLVLPSFYQGMADLAFDVEKYNGYWAQNGDYKRDPTGYQYRLNLGYAQRLTARWQASVLVPYVWNINAYESGTTSSDGIGDTTLNLWYEAVADRSAWKIRTRRDLIPAVTIGPSLTVPTGISPYDGATGSDITGRGFYRLDGNALITKSLHPWSGSLSLSYGTYLERPVNREGHYIAPYRKKLGDRAAAALSLSYIYYVGTGGDTLTGTGSLSWLNEQNATFNGTTIPSSGFRKESLGASLAYSSTDHDWSTRASWSHAVRQDGWGENFPTTDIYTLGVSYGFR